MTRCVPRPDCDSAGDGAKGVRLAAGNPGEKPMNIQRNGSPSSSRGAAEWFTGNVRVEPLFQSPGPARIQQADAGGKVVDWLEKVSDEQFRSPLAAV